MISRNIMKRDASTDWYIERDLHSSAFAAKIDGKRKMNELRTMTTADDGRERDNFIASYSEWYDLQANERGVEKM